LSVPPLLVVVVAYRADALLADCLAELGPGASVTVVDNDASPDTKAVVAGAGALYVAAPANLGFAGGVNLGLQHSWDGTTDVLLLNPDARIGAAGVGRLQQVLAAHPRCAATSPQLLDGSGTAQRVAWPFPSPAYAWAEALGLARLWRGRQFLVGAVLMLRGPALAEVGPFDERYFLYAEETDWQQRAGRAGWSMQVAGEVTALHAGAASSANVEVRERLFHAGKEIYTRKWHGTVGWTVLRAACLAAAARRSVIGRDRAAARRELRLFLHGPVREARTVGATVSA
jgi:GT2 family glycosyltransferase